MPNIDCKDRRVFTRFCTALPMQYVNNPAHIKGSAQAINISANGIGVLSNRGLPLHTPLDLWVDVPDSPTPFYTRGEVEWVKWVWFGQYRIGIALQRVDFMGISRTIKKINDQPSSNNILPSFNKWERVKLSFIYYRALVLKSLGLRKVS